MASRPSAPFLVLFLAPPLWLLSAGALGGCIYDDYTNNLGPLPPEVPVVERRARYGRDGKLTAEWTAQVFSNGTELKHGAEREWFQGGGPRAEREFRAGEPAGTWRTWYESGGQQSLLHFREQGDGEATWWHESGELAAHGATRGGVNSGVWTYYYPNGVRSEEGRFEAGLREGEWTYWWDSGAVRARGVHFRNRRQGPWQEWDREGRATLGEELAE